MHRALSNRFGEEWGQRRAWHELALATKGSARNWLTITGTPPLFFVSVDSRGFTRAVRCLESTLRDGSVNADSNEFTCAMAGENRSPYASAQAKN